MFIFTKAVAWPPLGERTGNNGDKMGKIISSEGKQCVKKKLSLRIQSSTTNALYQEV